MAKSFRDWEREISRRVFVDSDGLTLGKLTELLADMWQDAQEPHIKAKERDIITRAKGETK